MILDDHPWLSFNRECYDYGAHEQIPVSTPENMNFHDNVKIMSCMYHAQVTDKYFKSPEL